MDFFAFIALFGGLALFLYGVSLMGGSLENAALGGMGRGLDRLAGSPLRGALLGAAATAMVQSSSAAAVVTAELVGAGALPLRQAAGVILGANVGTTATAHLLCLGEGKTGLLRLLSPSGLGTAAVILGTGVFLLEKKDRPRMLGQLLLGFGLLFTGMAQMESAAAPLRDDPAFLRLLGAAENPLLGVLAGAAATAVIQSSSASVGILQAAASSGAVPFSAAVTILLGQNIGTCVTPLLGSIGGGRGAKQTAALHLLVNLLGAGLFLALFWGPGRALGAAFWRRRADKRGIAWFHTAFNLTLAAVFLPLSGWLERFVRRLIPDEV